MATVSVSFASWMCWTNIGIKPTLAMDALTAEHYPFLVRHCLERRCEIIGHGISVNRMITSRMSEQEEREYIRTSMDDLDRATGKPPTGWLGPEYGESTRTPALLAQAGIRYVCDWVNDEQPYPMNVPKGSCTPCLSLPLDDINALWDRRIDIDRYGGMIRETFETLIARARTTGGCWCCICTRGLSASRFVSAAWMPR